MATSSPMQDFLRNMMEVKQYQMQQQSQVNQAAQFAQQQALAQRQIENSEIEQFAQMAGKVNNPQELTALANYFSERSPGQAPVFQQLANNLAPTMQAQINNAMYRAGPEAVQRSWEIGADLQLGATGQQRGQQFEREIGQREQQFNTNLAENRRQFNQSFSQRESQFGQQMSLNYSQLGQQYELGMLNAMSPIERFMTNRGTLSTEANSLRQKLNGPISTDTRAAIERQISDIERQQAQLDSLLAAEIANKRGSSGGGMDLNQLFTAEAAAWQDINEAKDRGTKESAVDRYNRLRSFMPMPGPSLMYQDTWKPWDAGVYARPDSTVRR